MLHQAHDVVHPWRHVGHVKGSNGRAGWTVRGRSAGATHGNGRKGVGWRRNQKKFRGESAGFLLGSVSTVRATVEPYALWEKLSLYVDASLYTTHLWEKLRETDGESTKGVLSYILTTTMASRGRRG